MLRYVVRLTILCPRLRPPPELQRPLLGKKNNPLNFASNAGRLQEEKGKGGTRTANPRKITGTKKQSKERETKSTRRSVSVPVIIYGHPRM